MIERSNSATAANIVSSIRYGMQDPSDRDRPGPPLAGAERVCLDMVVTAGLVIIVLLALYITRAFSVMQLSRGQAEFWDTIFKGIGGMIAVAGGLFSLRKYLDEHKTENKTALLEARKPFMAKQQQIFEELTTLTAMISNKRFDDPLRQKAEHKFWVLFWGAVPMVADYEVGAAVNSFSECMDHPERDIALRNASMELALACRRALGFAGPDAQMLVDFPAAAAERASRQS